MLRPSKLTYLPETDAFAIGSGRISRGASEAHEGRFGQVREPFTISRSQTENGADRTSLSLAMRSGVGVRRVPTQEGRFTGD